ncbi:hypothetical protein [Solilutibacter silvestris]|nr:hypothetical protein [Lysobacter silvestris]
MWRALSIAMLFGLPGLLAASAQAVPMAVVQTSGAEPATAAVDPGNARDGVGQPHGKVMRRCARRSKLGICERWNMPKSTAPAKPRPDSRNPPLKH